MKLGYCKVCNKKLSKVKYNYCRSCRTKEQWKAGIRKNKGRHFPRCLDCNKEFKNYRKRTRCQSCWAKFNRGEHHKLWKSLKFCIDCGKKIFKYSNVKRCRQCNNKFHSGNLNGRWIDGRSYKKYTSSWITLSRLIRKRDNYRCCICGLTQKKYDKIYKRALDVHHIDHNKDNNIESNLITVCRKCHSRL